MVTTCGKALVPMITATTEAANTFFDSGCVQTVAGVVSLQKAYHTLARHTASLCRLACEGLQAWKQAVGHGQRPVTSDEEEAWKYTFSTLAQLGELLQEKAEVFQKDGVFLGKPRLVGLAREAARTSRGILARWKSPVELVGEADKEISQMLQAARSGVALARSSDLRSLAKEVISGNEAESINHEEWAGELAADLAAAND